MKKCTSSTNVSTSIPLTISPTTEEVTLLASGTSKRGQSVDDLAITASKPSWKDNLKAKRQKLKQRSITFDHFYRYFSAVPHNSIHQRKSTTTEQAGGLSLIWRSLTYSIRQLSSLFYKEKLHRFKFTALLHFTPIIFLLMLGYFIQI